MRRRQLSRPNCPALPRPAPLQVQLELLRALAPAGFDLAALRAGALGELDRAEARLRALLPAQVRVAGRACVCGAGGCVCIVRVAGRGGEGAGGG